jgi:hypothetical protein
MALGGDMVVKTDFVAQSGRFFISQRMDEDMTNGMSSHFYFLADKRI